MNDTINIGQRVEKFEISPEFSGVTKLICNIDDDRQLSAGDDSGYTIEFSNPLMTQAILNSMLAKIRGYKYQPADAQKALLDPAAEIGDAMTANGVQTNIFNRSRKFNN